MIYSMTAVGSAKNKIFNVANVPAVIALFVVLSGAIFAERLNNKVSDQRARADLLHNVNLIASRLQGHLSANVESVRGLGSSLSIEPNMTQKRFGELARNLFIEESPLNNVAASRGLIVSYVYPMVGNEAVIGLDYRKNESQREAAIKTRESAQVIVTGPVELVQGGQGFIARLPVFNIAPTGQEVFWGIVSAVISSERIYDLIGLRDNPDVAYALVGRNSTGPEGEIFYGAQSTLEGDPVFVDIPFSGGVWRLAARPISGWKTSADNTWVIRLFALVAAILVVAPITAAGWLFSDRYRRALEHDAAQYDLKRLSMRLELALQTSQIGIWEFEVKEQKLYWDRRMRELYECRVDKELQYADWYSRVHPDDRDRAVEEFGDALANQSNYHSEYRLIMNGGGVRTIRAIGTTAKDREGNLRIVGVNWDISDDVERSELLQKARAESDFRNVELEAAKVRIERESLHDFLTELPNRRYLDDMLHNHAHGDFNIDQTNGLLKIDLDRFKQINDTLGHAAGDAMLVHAADVLRRIASPTDFIARIGGDEFVILCRAISDQSELSDLATAIVAEMATPVSYQGQKCRLGASIGVAFGADADGNADRLLSNADIALYRAKEDGRGQCCVFTNELHKITISKRSLADEIMNGIEQGEFFAHFQGQFCAHSRELCGVEALARWQHPTRGLLAPFAFLDAAESLHVMGEIDAIVLEHSLAEMNSWREIGLNVPNVSVNVSARRLSDENLISNLKKLSFEPGTLTFELVESTFLDKSEDIVAWNIDQIRELSIDIEIDDFGTGYASIVSLMQLRPNRLKIDRQLVLPTVDSPGQRKLVQSIVDIGASLGIGAIAEGVETMAHADIMRDIGCDMLQGYAFAKPVSSSDFITAELKRQAEKKRA